MGKALARYKSKDEFDAKMAYSAYERDKALRDTESQLF